MRNTYAIATGLVGAKAPELRVRVREDLSTGDMAVVITADLRDVGNWHTIGVDQLRPIDDAPDQCVHDSALVFMESV